jgi:putative membrane protein
MIVINALMLELTAKFVSGFAFASFGWAMIIAFLISLANALLTSRVSVQKY